MSSIRLRLLKWLLGPVLLVNFGAAGLTYLFAWTPARLAFDQDVLASANALAAQVRARPEAAPRVRPPADAGDGPLWFALRDARGRLLAGTPLVPAMAGPGALRDAELDGEPVRVASVVADGFTIAVAKSLRKHRQVRSAIVRALLLLEAVFSLAMAGLVWFAVTNGLAPLARLRARLNARGPEQLDPLGAEDMALELAPVVEAFNALLARLAAGAQAQDEFLANVAHQLRTPLAGLKLQLEGLALRHHADRETVESVRLMLLANERMIRQVNQLLTLERAKPGHFDRGRLELLDLADLVGEAVQHFVVQAAGKDIDLGFELAAATVRGDRFLLRDLIDNLVDNALRYTPCGGRVTVRCQVRDGAVLEVEDTGPGIPAARRAAVFERFVRLDERIPGSGLGLAIVRDIARVHGARVRLDASPGAQGALFSVHFPAG